MFALEVEPVKSEGGDCFDDVIVTLDGWFRKGYKLMYANALKFEWAPATPGANFGSRMQTGLNDILALLGQFHGFDIRVVRNPSPEEGLQIIREQLDKENPVCLNVDTYYCPWDHNFGKIHYYTHVVVVVGIDSVTGELLIVDPFFSRKDLRFSEAQYAAGLLGVMSVDPAPGWSFDRSQLLSRLRRLLQNHLATTPDHFRRFADEIGSVRFEEEVGEGTGEARFMSSQLYMKLNALHTARINYAGMLAYVADTFDVRSLAACIEDVRRLGNPWSTVRGMLAKLNFMPPDRRNAKLMDSLGVKIRSALEAETSVLERVLICLDEEAHASASHPQVAPTLRDVAPRLVVPLDLTELCNVRGIENSHGTADIDEDGHSYARENLPADGRLTIGDLSFMFPSGDGDYDNVSCFGQTVPLTPDNYSGLMVLASSQYGGSVDVFTVEYADGSSEQVPFGFADWWSASPIAGEKIAWSASLVSNTTGTHANRVYLFANEAPLTRTTSTAVRLVLPTMPNLHVFAVSLWK